MEVADVFGGSAELGLLFLIAVCLAAAAYCLTPEPISRPMTVARALFLLAAIVFLVVALIATAVLIVARMG